MSAPPKEKMNKSQSERHKTARRVLTRVLLVAFIALTLAGSVFGFWVVWQTNAVTIQQQSGPTYSAKGGYFVANVNSSITVQNYQPAPEFITLQFVRTVNAPAGSNVTYPSQKDLIAHNFTISKITYQEFYGDQPLNQPAVWKNVTQYLLQVNWYQVQEMAVAKLTVAWSYSTSNINQDGFFLSTPVSASPSPVQFGGSAPYHTVSEDTYQIEGVWGFVYRYGLPILSFSALGVAVALLMRSKIKAITDGLNFVQKEASTPDGSIAPDLERNLRVLKDTPSQLGYAFGVFFGPALALYKVIATRSVDTLSHQLDLKKITPKNDKPPADKSSKDKSPMDVFLSDPDMSPIKSLVDFRNVTLVLAFLTSVGITLKWNGGAVLPFLIAVGLSYLCFNLGFLAILVRKSFSDMISTIALIVVIFFVMVLPDAITIWQGGTIYPIPIP
jgi:hypothetical protein